MSRKYSALLATSALSRWLAIFVLLAGLLWVGLKPAQAALALRFNVPTSTADLFINADGTATVEYTYVFDNTSGGDPIDAVDIGMPTTSYDLSSASGTVNGQPVESIEKSPYVDPGIALNLGSGTIQAGQTGQVQAHIGVIKRILFKASEKEAEAYGSFQFQPNFFDSQYVSGQTDMTVTLHLPPGLKAEEPRYFTPKDWPGAAEPETAIDDQGRVYYRWHAANASSSKQYTFGASFPARIVPAGVLLTETPNINLDSLCPFIICAGIVGFIILIIYSSIVGNRKRKLDYLPPKVSVEGNGIKRGLTAPEAAVLMQQPMDKILTMLLFAVVKKGAATVTSRDPMKIEVTTPAPADLQTYESEFLHAMSLPTTREQRSALQDLMTNLVKSVAEKMRGFSRKETVAYYQDIMTKAWQQIEQANTPEMKMQAFDESMGWSMLDRNFDDRTRNVFGQQPVFMPMWWGRFDPGMAGRVGPAAPSMPSAPMAGNLPPQGINLPSLPGADFAASITNGMQSFASNVVGDVTSFTGGVTQKTNPPPPPTKSSGSGGSGGSSHSCACACACAGCACACAGGGR